MLKFTKIITIFALLLSAITACGDTDTLGIETTVKPLVYASFYPMYDIAGKAAGDFAEVRCLIPNGVEPHDWEPSPKDVVELEKADLFIYSSKNLEPWAESVAVGLKNKNLIVLEASSGAESLGNDPHTWLYPIEAKRQMIEICDALRLIDPENADKYTTNELQWAAEFDKLDAEYSALRGLSQNKIMVTHAAFGYLCAAYGLEQLPIVDGAADVEPDPARMAKIVIEARENGINTIFYEEISGSKLAKAITGEIGVKAAPLSPLEGLTDEQRINGDDYFSVMRKNLDVLLKALT